MRVKGTLARGTLTRVRGAKIRVSSSSSSFGGGSGGGGGLLFGGGGLRGSSRCLRLLPLFSISIILAALAILALSEISLVGKEPLSGVMGGGGAAARIMPGRAHSRSPQHHKATHQQGQQAQGVGGQSSGSQSEKGISFKMEPLLRRDAASVELTAQLIVNRFRARRMEEILERESSSADLSSSVGKLEVEKWLETGEGGEDSVVRLSEGLRTDCSPRHAVALIIPYRDREAQLVSLLAYLPPILDRQQIRYRIFVVEQVGNDTFNKGVLMNAGALTALEHPLAPGVIYHCLIFHDVDMLPEDDRILYTCPQQPRHLSVAVNELDYKLPYRQLVGGVFAIRTDHFLRVNGYSNLYWGWGGEDDDMGYRVEHVLSWISRPPEWIARYSMMKHEKRRPLARKVRTKLLRTSWRRYRLDGLNTVVYGLMGVRTEHPGYVRIRIDVGHPPASIRQIQREEEAAVT